MWGWGNHIVLSFHNYDAFSNPGASSLYPHLLVPRLLLKTMYLRRWNDGYGSLVEVSDTMPYPSLGRYVFVHSVLRLF